MGRNCRDATVIYQRSLSAGLHARKPSPGARDPSPTPNPPLTRSDGELSPLDNARALRDSLIGLRERRGRDSNPRWSVNPILAYRVGASVVCLGSPRLSHQHPVGWHFSSATCCPVLLSTASITAPASAPVVQPRSTADERDDCWSSCSGETRVAGARSLRDRPRRARGRL